MRQASKAHTGQRRENSPGYPQSPFCRGEDPHRAGRAFPAAGMSATASRAPGCADQGDEVLNFALRRMGVLPQYRCGLVESRAERRCAKIEHLLRRLGGELRQKTQRPDPHDERPSARKTRPEGEQRPRAGRGVRAPRQGAAGRPPDTSSSHLLSARSSAETVLTIAADPKHLCVHCP
jgi:hypothetical protein